MENPTDHTHDLTLNTGLAKSILVNFIRDAIQSAGFQKGILGLSGGVDSALSAHLAAEALGAENLLCVIMPYRSSNPGSRTDAELVAAGLGVRTEVVDISPMVDAHAKRVDADAKVRLGNIMARERMVVLYDISARDRGLVIGTGNKTETLLGYGTLFGDMACALNPLGDLYKTQVWQLAESVGVPRAIIDKQPSADLWEGQRDEHELGFTYAEADRLLYCMVDERRSNEELVSMGFEERLIKEIQERVRKNQFKRRPPLVAKISNRTTNIDFRYPREWGV
jgi:NAD+ synthase